jgi:heme/copper-type cytochrome/quinol oxidase subunit 1
MTVLPSFVFSHHVLPRELGSKDNLGPFINVVTWILLITSTLAVLTRLITKRALARRIKIDDGFVIAALV